MAVIGKIRQKSGLVIAVVGIALAAFVLGDLFKSSNTRGTLLIGEVNGEKIPGTEFNEKAEQNINYQKQNYKRSLTAQETFSVKQQTWNSMVQDILTKEQYDKLGLTVTDEELIELMSGQNPHDWAKRNFLNENGVYDPVVARNAMANYSNMNDAQKKQWRDIENYISNDRLRTKYLNLIGNSYYVPKAMAKNDYEVKGTKADIEYFGVKYNTISDSAITVSDADYKKYYEEHKEEYKLNDEQREIDYVTFDIRPSIEDLKKARKDIEEVLKALKETDDIATFVNRESDKRYDSTWYVKGKLPAKIEDAMFNSEVGEIFGPYQENEAFHIAKLVDIAYRPDSLKASHILVSYRGAQSAGDVTRTREEAKKRADSILKVVKRRGVDFAEKAKELSEGPSASNGGDLGWFADGQMLHNFNQACIDNKKGSYVIAETMYGFHVIKVTDKKANVKKVRVALIDQSINAGNKTNNDIYAQASAFAGKNRDLESFEATAKEKGYVVKNYPTLSKLTMNMPGIDNARNISQWAFKDGNGVGTVSDVMEIDGAYIVAVVKKVKEKGYAKLEDIKDKISVLVKREKKAELVMAQINDALKGSTIDKAASKLGTSVETSNNLTFKSYNIPGFGREVKVIGSIFGLKQGTTSKAIKGNTAAFVVKVNKLIPAASISDYTTNQNTMASTYKRKAQREVIKALENKAEITDNRSLFY